VCNPAIAKKRVIRGSELPPEKNRITREIQALSRQCIHYLSDVSNLTLLLYVFFTPTFLLFGTFLMRQSTGISPGERGLDTLEIVLKCVVWCSLLQGVILCRITVLCINNPELLSEKNKIRILIASVLIALLLNFVFGFVSL
jgi:hypothetical protein